MANLLDNAVKWSPTGGTVEVASTSGRVTVRDHGPGIPEAERGTLYAPFSRTQAARRSGMEGTGLGLYITRRIVEAHAGSIGVHDTPGGGATFVIILPRESTPDDAPPPG